MSRTLITTLGLGLASAALATPVTLGLGRVTLHGTLELPEGRGPFPVALIVAGSGPTDRDGNSAALPGRNDSLRSLARELARQGVASVRYDKRGIGSSVTAEQEQDVTLDTFVNDATAWAKQLAADPRFRGVSLVGHSEGALIALLAAGRTDVKAVVSIAGPGENLADTLLRQVRSNPANPPAIVQDVEKTVAELRAGRTVATVNPLLAPLFRPSVQPFLISAFRHDPARVIATLKVPVLIAQGDRDLQVTPADADRLHAARPDGTLAIFPGMNHVLKQVGNDTVLNTRSYTDPTVPFETRLADRVATFLKEAHAR